MIGPAAGLKIATQIDAGNRPPSTMAAYFARDYRDALTPALLASSNCVRPRNCKSRWARTECVIEP